MRDPFQLPADCDPVSFDIDIIPDPLPICTLPPFTNPTMVPPDLFVSIPYGPPPWNCVTAPSFSVATATGPDRNKHALSMHLHVWQINADACEPSYTAQLDLVFPCLPLVVTANYTIMLDPGRNANDPSMAFSLTRQADAGSSESSDGSSSGGASPGCDLQANLQIQLPMCTVSCPEVVVVNFEKVSWFIEPSGSGSLLVEPTSEYCELTLELNLKIPWGCVSHNYVHTVYWDNGIWVGRSRINKNCESFNDGDTMIMGATEC